MPADSRRFDTPSGLRICALDAVADGASRSVRLHLPGGWFDGFLIRRGDRAFGWLDMCPHAGVRLQRIGDDYLNEDRTRIACCWHGAQFEIETGACVAGPCGGQRLSPWPLAVIDGVIVTAS